MNADPHSASGTGCPSAAQRELHQVPPHGMGPQPRRPRPVPPVPGQRRVWQLPGRDEHTPRQARTLVALQCLRWDVPPQVVDDLSLIVAELATNAVRHAPADMVTVSVVLAAEEVAVVVADHGGPHPPVQPHEAAEDDESGRGLFLVDALASRCAAEPTDAGTTVWACVALTPPTPAKDTDTDARTHPH